MLQHEFKRLLTSLLAQFGEDGDVPTEQSLYRRPHVPNDGAGSNGDATHNPEFPGDLVAVQREGGGVVHICHDDLNRAEKAMVMF